MTEFKSIKELEKEIEELDKLVIGVDISEIYLNLTSESLISKLHQTQAIIKLIEDKIIQTRNNEDGTVNALDHNYNQGLRELIKELKGET